MDDRGDDAQTGDSDATWPQLPVTTLWELLGGCLRKWRVDQGDRYGPEDTHAQLQAPPSARPDYQCVSSFALLPDMYPHDRIRCSALVPALQEVEANVSLASYPMLEDLQLMLCMEYCNEKHSYAWHSSRLFADILSTASVQAPLHSITIKLLVVEGLKDVPVHLSEDSVDWRRLDEVIGAFPALRNLDVVFLFVEAAPERSDLVNDSLQELVRRGLRANHARGILHTKIE